MVCNRILLMQRFGACLGVGAMLLVLLTAPLFHFHDRDDHGTSISLVHAHLWEFAEPDHHSTPEIESPHSHNNARWVDFFVCKAPSGSPEMQIDFPDKLSSPVLEVHGPITIALSAQAHGPPDTTPSRPRSPPSI